MKQDRLNFKKGAKFEFIQDEIGKQEETETVA